MRPTLIYFIRPAGKRGPIKIGCSITPEKRLASLSPFAPFPLEIMGSISGDFDDESFIHQCFAADHVHGEWFKGTPHVRKFVAKIIKAGAFPRWNYQK